jgi:hypothetical protein
MDALNNPVLQQQGPLVITIADLSTCYYCNSSPLTEGIVFCPSCGFPQRGLEDDQKKFITNKRILLIQLDGMHDKVKKARNALFITAGVMLLSYGVAFVQYGSAVMIEGGVVISAFVGFGFWANKNPFPAVLTGLIFLLTLYVLYAIVNPATIVSGIIIKIAIIAALVYGLKAALQAKKLKAELEAQKIDLSN